MDYFKGFLWGVALCMVWSWTSQRDEEQPTQQATAAESCISDSPDMVTRSSVVDGVPRCEIEVRVPTKTRLALLEQGLEPTPNQEQLVILHNMINPLKGK